MIKKSQLLEENIKLKRKVFIWENIGIGINASVKEKEITAEKFLNEHPDYNLYEVSELLYEQYQVLDRHGLIQQKKYKRVIILFIFYLIFYQAPR